MQRQRHCLWTFFAVIFAKLNIRCRRVFLALPQKLSPRFPGSAPSNIRGLSNFISMAACMMHAP